MLEKAWRQGTLCAGDWVVEASSGSTSIALALAAAQMGLRFVAVMPEGVTEERVLIIRAYGAEVVLTSRSDGVRGSMAHVERWVTERGGFAPRQFENPDNAEAHRMWTGQEILAQIPGGAVDAVVSGVGTGGTIVGLHDAFVEAGCPLATFAARPVTGGTGLGDVECCSFSSRIPGVVESLSKIYVPERLNNLVELTSPTSWPCPPRPRSSAAASRGPQLRPQLTPPRSRPPAASVRARRSSPSSRPDGALLLHRPHPPSGRSPPPPPAPPPPRSRSPPPPRRS
jgi:cysteine synthase